MSSSEQESSSYDSSSSDDDSMSSVGLGYVDDPPDSELTPWYFVDRETKIVTVYEDKEYIKRALVKSMMDDTDDGDRFKGWDKTPYLGDSVFEGYMFEHLKGPRKMFHTPREAYDYLKAKYPEDDYSIILVYERT